MSKNYSNKMREVNIKQALYPLRLGQILCSVFETSNQDLWFEEDPKKALERLNELYDHENDIMPEECK